MTGNGFAADWSAMTSGTTNNLNGVWGSSGSDVFAVGDSGTILHYDGTAWSAVASPTANNLNSVWGSSATDAFAVGDNGTILHYDGLHWSTVASRQQIISMASGGVPAVMCLPWEIAAPSSTITALPGLRWQVRQPIISIVSGATLQPMYLPWG